MGTCSEPSYLCYVWLHMISTLDLVNVYTHVCIALYVDWLIIAPAVM